MLDVSLFGQFKVQYDGRRLSIPTRNAQALFAYLILNAGKAQRRERLAGLLWPDSSDDNARSNLRHELWRLRKTFETEGASYFLINDLTIAFNPSSEYSLDVHRLEKESINDNLVDDLMESLSVYQGEFLPGFYEEWVFVERNRLHALFEAKIARLLDILQADSRWTETVDWGIRWITVEKWSEPAYRALISAYANNGDLSKATATYEHFRSGLQKDLGIKPSEQTQALYKRIKAGWIQDNQRELLIRSTLSLKSLPEIASPSLPLPKLRQSNLPKPLTSFIGRESEIKQVEHLVSRARLVTITGPGGVGKTRLAIQAAGGLTTLFQDGVCWVELATLVIGQAGLTRAEQVAQTIAKALRIPESPGHAPLDGALDYLQNKELLLLLDNCEHLIKACAVMAERLLAECPHVVILATSREALGVPGEIAWLLPSLSLPGQEYSRESSKIFQSEAISLFIERAGDIIPSYRPSEMDVITIAQICLRLDGIPLAIELAAARMNLLSLREIASRLDRRFSLLTGGIRTALPRHQTLHAAIEWSYDLLEQSEQVLFRRLSIFASSFTLDAAENICSSREIHQDQVLTTLGRLVDKSLLQVDCTAPSLELATRYRLLDTICSFARLKLDEADETSWMLGRHADYYMRLGEGAEHEILSQKVVHWHNLLQAEKDNLQAAIEWSIEKGDTAKARQLLEEAITTLRLSDDQSNLAWLRNISLKI